jgi:hypothetical protein
MSRMFFEHALQLRLFFTDGDDTFNQISRMQFFCLYSVRSSSMFCTYASSTVHVPKYFRLFLLGVIDAPHASGLTLTLDINAATQLQEIGNNRFVRQQIQAHLHHYLRHTGTILTTYEYTITLSSRVGSVDRTLK